MDREAADRLAERDLDIGEIRVPGAADRPGQGRHPGLVDLAGRIDRQGDLDRWRSGEQIGDQRPAVCRVSVGIREHDVVGRAAGQLGGTGPAEAVDQMRRVGDTLEQVDSNLVRRRCCVDRQVDIRRRRELVPDRRLVDAARPTPEVVGRNGRLGRVLGDRRRERTDRDRSGRQVVGWRDRQRNTWKAREQHTGREQRYTPTHWRSPVRGRGWARHSLGTAQATEVQAVCRRSRRVTRRDCARPVSEVSRTASLRRSMAASNRPRPAVRRRAPPRRSPGSS